MSSCEVDRTGCSVKKTVELLLPECIVHAEAIAEIVRAPWLRVDFFIMGTQGVRINRLSYTSNMVLPYVDRHIGDIYAQAFLRRSPLLFKSSLYTFLDTTLCEYWVPHGKGRESGWMHCRGSADPRLPYCPAKSSEESALMSLAPPPSSSSSSSSSSAGAAPKLDSLALASGQSGGLFQQK